MTICVAALSTHSNGGLAVVGAADRMKTAGSTEFETELSKAWLFSSSIIALCSGDNDLQNALLVPVGDIVTARINEAPKVWWKVEDVANLYREEYFKVRSKRAERTYLEPLGLRMDTLIARQKDMDRFLVDDLTNKLWNFEMPATETIFMGVDPTGTRLFMWVNEELHNRGVSSFASIGAGFKHADSEMMSAGHTWRRSLEDTIVLVHSAKKRAEAAPGVGKSTDMYVIGPNLGSVDHINSWDDGKAFAELERQYKRRVRQEKSAAEKTAKPFKDYMATRTKATLPQDKKIDLAPGTFAIKGGEAEVSVSASSEPEPAPGAVP